MKRRLTIAIPSKGRMKDDTLAAFAKAGLEVQPIADARAYRTTVKGRRGIEIALMSASEIARELAALRPGALLVNVGRGPTLDEAAIYNALRGGTLRAAGIDVWYAYPQTLEERTSKAPSRFPFHELDNVVMSPHRGGWLSEAEVDRLDQLAALLNAAATGQPMANRVDKALGY